LGTDRLRIGTSISSALFSIPRALIFRRNYERTSKRGAFRARGEEGVEQVFVQNEDGFEAK